MPRILTHLLVIHWAVVFSLLAGLTVFGGDMATLDGLRFFGIDLSRMERLIGAAPAACAFVAIVFAFCATLFWWALATSLFTVPADPAAGEDVLRIAFGAAAGMMTVLLAVGVLAGAAGIFPVMAAHYAALISSYVAIRAEQQHASKTETPAQEKVRLAARVRAIDASSTLSLPRLVETRDRRWAGWEGEH